MNWKKSGLILSLIFGNLSLNFETSFSQEHEKMQLFLSEGIAQTKLKQASNFEPPNDGAPGDREDRGSRPGCPQVEKRFTALIPATNLGLTVDEHPTFWLYIPYQFSSSKTLELVLKDENTKETVYRTTFSVTRGSGIFSFRLPPNAPTLDVGKKYRWKFDFFCNSGSKSEFVSVNGVILRKFLEPAVARELETALPEERMAFYGRNGLWYDILTELGELRRTKPQDTKILEEWVSLLDHPMIRLEKLIYEPIY